MADRNFLTTRSLFAGLALLLLSTVASAAGLRGLASSERPTMVPDEVVVAFQPGRSLGALSTGATRLMANSRALGSSPNGTQFARLKLRQGVALEDALAMYRADPSVLAVSPNYLRYTDYTPNDTSFGGTSLMWGMNNTGQTIASPVYTTNNPGTADADVDAFEAWDATRNVTGVIVAVIDTGVDYTHPELTGAMWDATGATTPSNFFGWDFADNDSDPYPLGSNHGTHVAGTIAAIEGNATGVAGMAFGARIMALKVFSDKGGGASDADIIAAINYAAANGAHIVNMSLGGAGPENAVWTTAVANAISAGVLMVAAAGNSNINNDSTTVWPANYAGHASTQSGFISVLATDQRDQRASFSNFGVANVSVGAPGVNIQSTITGRNVLQQEALASVGATANTHCSSAGATCMDNTIFNQGGVDCAPAGANCRWGVYKQADSEALYADNDTLTAIMYANSINGTIVSQTVNTSGAQRVVLRYLAFWDLECDNDYVDVEISADGTNWQLLTAPDFNYNNTLTGLCASSHTHTGRAFPAFGAVEIAHDITALATSTTTLRARFRFVTNGSNPAVSPAFTILGGFGMNDIFIDVQATNYSTSYSLFNGTSMASPMVAGVAALVKSRYPSYTVADIKRAVVDTGDTVSSLSSLVASGRRVNALNALRRPAISSTTPATAVAGSAGFTLTLDGVNFESNAVVRWNGTNLATTFVSATRLTAVVAAAQLASTSDVPVTVNNPNAPTLTSSARTFSVSAPLVGGGGGGGGGGGCFIATAAYGTPMAEDVRYLRAFRDQFLLTSGLGRKFVELYYRHSPPLADKLRAQDGWRSVVRAALAPLVALSKWIVDGDVLDKQTSDRP